MRKSSAVAALIIGHVAFVGCTKDDDKVDDVVVKTPNSVKTVDVDNDNVSGDEVDAVVDVDGDTDAVADVGTVGAADKRTETDTQGDNSKRNDEDVADAKPTADDQSNGESDVEITRKIRRALTSNDDLSTYAQNIKIITNDGKVVLKGPVRSAQEKSQAEAVAREVAGPQAVTNELVITPK